MLPFPPPQPFHLRSASHLDLAKFFPVGLPAIEGAGILDRSFTDAQVGMPLGIVKVQAKPGRDCDSVLVAAACCFGVAGAAVSAARLIAGDEITMNATTISAPSVTIKMPVPRQCETVSARSNCGLGSIDMPPCRPAIWYLS